MPPIEEEATVSQIFSPEALTQTRAPSVSLLICHRNGVQGVELMPHKPMTVGRVAPAEVVIRDSTLSRRHARFEIVDGNVWVEDLDSTNGTRLNGKRVTRTQVGVGDEVALGSVVVSIHMLSVSESHVLGLDSHDRFQHVLEEELLRAKTFARPLAVVMVSEAQRDQDKVHRWSPRIRELLRPVDRIALYGPSAIELLLPEMTQAEAERVARNIVGGRRAGEPALVAGVAIFPASATSAEELIQVSRDMVRDASEEQPVRSAEPLVKRANVSVEPISGEMDWVIVSAAMVEVRKTVQRLAQSMIPVLITGETGTGKEVIARAIHQGGARKNQPLRCINCGAIPESLIESVLFGHERGAFTGAERRTKGVFEEAEGGTVLLDEIGELTPTAQAALLRVLETKRITRVGSNSEVSVDVRILAATHRDLERMCAHQQFRWDLLYRLNAVSIHVPPLRDRFEEIIPLAEHFLRFTAKQNNCDVREIDSSATTILQNYAWPGNIRELRNVIERAVVMARGTAIMADDLSERVRQSEHVTVVEPKRKRRPTLMSPAVGSGDGDHQAEAPQHAWEDRTAQYRGKGELDYKDRVHRFEQGIIGYALRKTKGNRIEAAALLGLSRRTMSNKLAENAEVPAISDDENHLIRSHEQPDGTIGFWPCVNAFETMVIREALEQAGGNQSRAARLLRMPSRTFNYKARELGVRTASDKDQ